MADEWYLMKPAEGNHVYGPATLDDLRSWATAAKIGPMDRVSSDGQVSWRRAPMVPELHMDWMVELEDKTLYGPTSISTIVEFLDNGEVDDSFVIINCREDFTTTIGECDAFRSQPRKVRQSMLSAAANGGVVPDEEAGPTAELEAKLTALAAEHDLLLRRYNDLRSKYIAEVGREP